MVLLFIIVHGEEGGRSSEGGGASSLVFVINFEIQQIDRADWPLVISASSNYRRSPNVGQMFALSLHPENCANAHNRH